ncbi:MAG: hypothetical protein ABI134_31180, partial [Byssovorax sp.]
LGEPGRLDVEIVERLHVLSIARCALQPRTISVASVSCGPLPGHRSRSSASSHGIMEVTISELETGYARVYQIGA